MWMASKTTAVDRAVGSDEFRHHLLCTVEVANGTSSFLAGVNNTKRTVFER